MELPRSTVDISEGLKALSVPELRSSYPNLPPSPVMVAIPLTPHLRVPEGEALLQAVSWRIEPVGVETRGERTEGKQRGAKEGGRFKERSLLSGLPFPVAVGSIHMEESLLDRFQENSMWLELGQHQLGAKGWLCIMAGSLGVLAVIAGSIV